MPITAEQFQQATGCTPQQDDLERSNCAHAGRTFHQDCGWCHGANLPNFMVSLQRREVAKAFC